jgi:sulfur relay protein TusB/DsrH
MAGDTVILIEDGVYGATLGQSSTLIKIRENIIKLVEAEVMFFALQPDFEARGLDRISLMQHFTLVDDSGFVELAVQADKTLSWY